MSQKSNSSPKFINLETDTHDAIKFEHQKIRKTQAFSSLTWQIPRERYGFPRDRDRVERERERKRKRVSPGLDRRGEREREQCRIELDCKYAFFVELVFYNNKWIRVLFIEKYCKYESWIVNMPSSLTTCRR